MYTAIAIFLIALVAGFIFMLFVIKYDSVELDPKAPLFNDEIETEGTHNLKIKK